MSAKHGACLRGQPYLAHHARRVAFRLWLDTTSKLDPLTGSSRFKVFLKKADTSDERKPRFMKSPNPFAGACISGPSIGSWKTCPASCIAPKASWGQIEPSTPLAGMTMGSSFVLSAAILPDLWLQVVITTKPPASLKSSSIL